MKHSPFAFFRKHQRIGMVILTVMAMFAFVFMDSVNKSSLTGSAGAASQVAVKVQGSNLTEMDLQVFRAQRQMVNSFIARVLYTISTADEENKLPEQQINRLIQENQFGVEWGEPLSDNALVWGHIMRLEGRRLGLVMTDPMVEAYILRMHENKLTAEQFKTILNIEGMRQKPLFDAFREELLARSAFRMTRPLIDHTAEQYWHYYRQLKVRQNLEVAALPVSEFAKGMKAPADSVLEKFFDQHKHRFPKMGPDFSQPGFRQPTKVLVQYLKSKYEEVEGAVAEPTDAEISDFYEKNKNTLYREFDKPKIGSEDDPLNPDIAPERPAAPATPEDTAPPPSAPQKDPAKPAPEKAADTPSAPEKAVEKPADSPAEKPAEEATEKPAENKPADEKSETPKTEEGKKEPCGAQPEAEKTDAAKAEAPAEKTEAQPAAAKADEPKAEEKKSADPKSEPGGAKAAAGKAADSKSTDAKTTPAKEPAGKDADAAFKTEPEVIKYQPLTDALKENIKAQLLVNKTTEALNKKAEAVLAKLDGLNLKYNLPVSVKGNTAFIDFNEDGDINRDTELGQDEPTVESKTPLDPDETDKVPSELTAELKQKVIKLAAAKLQSVGKQFGMTFSSTGMVSAEELSEIPGLGKVEEGNADPFQASQSPNILQLLFGKEQLFDASAGRDTQEKNLYVFWKTESSKTHIPKFTEPGIKELVLEAWKLQQAYPETLKRAEELAKLVGKQKLEVALKGQTVNNSKDGLPIQTHETGDFSWMNPPTPSPNSFFDMNPPTMSAPSFVPDPGDEFMEVACEDLAVGQAGVAPNRDHSVIYVMRVVNREPKPGEELDRLRESFMKERLFGIIPGRIPSLYTHLADRDFGLLTYHWMEGLKRKYGVEYTSEDKYFQ